MRCICAWCQRQGILTVLCEATSSGLDSHGICKKHAQEMLVELAIYRGQHAAMGQETRIVCAN